MTRFYGFYHLVVTSKKFPNVFQIEIAKYDAFLQLLD